MKAIIKRELKNYLKNPLMWVGLAVIIVELYMILSPYLKIHYITADQELEEMGELTVEQEGDADIMQGYVPSTRQQQYELGFASIREELVERLDKTEAEADKIIGELKEKNLTVKEISDYMIEHYHFYNADYYLQNFERHKGSKEEINAYISERLEEQPFSYYFAQKFADFTGLFMGFFATILLSFLFMRDTRRDTYELLHTKPVSAGGYVAGKVCGGFLVMTLIVVILNVIFAALCMFYGSRAGFPVRIWDFPLASIRYVLPCMLMIVSVYAALSLLFKNPLPAAPLLVLYIIYSNMGSIGADGRYGYYGRFLAIMVRFPGQFFEITPPPMVLMNQVFLVLASAVLTATAAVIWKRRRVY